MLRTKWNTRSQPREPSSDPQITCESSRILFFLHAAHVCRLHSSQNHSVSGISCSCHPASNRVSPPIINTATEIQARIP